MMTTPRDRSGFTLVELTVVVVLGALTMMAIYQSLITQERAYRYQSAAIDAQGTSRMALGVIASELREISASAGDDPAMGGSDLIAAARDSIRFRSFRKAGLVCAVTLGVAADIWRMGEPFVAGDSIMVFVEGDTLTNDDDTWITTVVTDATNSANNAGCKTSWPEYESQALVATGLLTESVKPGAIVRSYRTITYRAIQHDDDWVLGRRVGTDSYDPMVGPIMPPQEGGIEFRYFTRAGNEITPTTEAERAAVTRVLISVKALSRGRGPNNSDWVDSLSTNVYLRGN